MSLRSQLFLLAIFRLQFGMSSPQTMMSSDNKILSVDGDALDSLVEESASKGVPSCDDSGPGSTSTDDIESSTGNSNQEAYAAQEFERDLKRKILQEEDRNVQRARILVGIAFMTCVASVICGVYFFTVQSDQYAFEAEVSNDVVNQR